MLRKCKEKGRNTGVFCKMGKSAVETTTYRKTRHKKDNFVSERISEKCFGKTACITKRVILYYLKRGAVHKEK